MSFNLHISIFVLERLWWKNNWKRTSSSSCQLCRHWWHCRLTTYDATRNGKVSIMTTPRFQFCTEKRVRKWLFIIADERGCELRLYPMGRGLRRGYVHQMLRQKQLTGRRTPILIVAKKGDLCHHSPVSDEDTPGTVFNHDDVITWKHFPRYWPFVRGIHRPRWIPHTKASYAELWCLLWSAPEWIVE